MPNLTVHNDLSNFKLYGEHTSIMHTELLNAVTLSELDEIWLREKRFLTHVRGNKQESGLYFLLEGTYKTMLQFFEYQQNKLGKRNVSTESEAT